MTTAPNQKLRQLRNAKTLFNLAKLLNDLPASKSRGLPNLSKAKMAKTLYKKKTKYKEFSIPKKNGGIREIQAPIEDLSVIQKRLADFLEECDLIPVYKPCKVKENDVREESNRHLSIIHPKRIWSHGFRKKYEYEVNEGKEFIEYSIVTNAAIHVDKRYVLNFDIKDFFPSINFGRIRGYFINKVGVSEKIATIIAHIVCHDGRLPQGSPCSPIISNLIGHEFIDKRLAYFAKKNRCYYSRYADDITFSTNSKKFPEAVAFLDGEIWKISNDLEKIISDRGFQVNHEKTRVQDKKQRQTVTGLVVNKQINIRKEYYKLARAVIHSLLERGTCEIPSNISPVDIKEEPPKIDDESNLKKIDGIMNHIYNIKYRNNKERVAKTQEEERKKGNIIFFSNLDPIIKLYRSFLYYKNFIFQSDEFNAIVICEGSTDITHIRAAIKNLKVVEKNKFENMKIKFLQRSKLSKDILELGQGAGTLSLFIRSYYDTCKKLIKKYENIKFNTPIIVVVDNDKGGLESILDRIEGIEKKEKGKNKNSECINLIKNNSDKYFVLKEIEKEKSGVNNLYLVKLPHTNSTEEAKIEDLYSQIWRQQQKYPSENKKDGGFDKEKFAATTRANAARVDFSGFIPLLDRIDAAIQHHETRES